MKDKLYTCAGCMKLILLFALDACYIFAALGLFSFGLAAFPCVLLGNTGVLTVTSDIAQLPLLLISGGILTLGAGLCFGIIPLCRASYGIYAKTAKTAAIRRERMANEEDRTS